MTALTLFDDAPPIDLGLRAHAETFPTPALSDVQGRRGTANGLLRLDGRGRRIAGRAFTVLTREGDNLALHLALSHVLPGDILCVDGGGWEGRALAGDLIYALAQRRGVAALVIDGAVRDLHDRPAEAAVPVWARTITPRGPLKDGPGELRGPVSIGGVVVNQGDLAVLDDDGAVFIRADEADEVLDAASRLIDGEHLTRQAIAEDRWERPWLGESLTVQLRTRPRSGAHQEETNDH